MSEPIKTLPIRPPLERVLPHRFPFLLVDRITEFVAGERIIAVKTFAADDSVCQDYFPGDFIVPSSVLIELVTQVGAVLVLQRPGMEGKIALILQVPRAEMSKLVRAGETLRVEAKVVRIKENFGELYGTIHRGSELIGEGQMRFAIAPAP